MDHDEGATFVACSMSLDGEVYGAFAPEGASPWALHPSQAPSPSLRPRDSEDGRSRHKRFIVFSALGFWLAVAATALGVARHLIPGAACGLLAMICMGLAALEARQHLRPGA